MAKFLNKFAIKQLYLNIYFIYLSKPHGIQDTLTVGKKGHMKYKSIQVTIDYLKEKRIYILIKL